LIAGFRRFRETYYEQNRPLFDALARKEQSPQVMMISCCDSRVDPALLFASEPGDLFVIRNVANLIPPYAPDSQYHGTSAALEFAVCGLKVKHAVVLGHSRCGGVRALLQDVSEDAASDFVRPWMEIAAPARDRARWRAAGQPDEVLRKVCEQETVQVSLANLMTFPWIRERVETNQLQLHGWYFDLENGELYALQRSDGAFHPATQQSFATGSKPGTAAGGKPGTGG